MLITKDHSSPHQYGNGLSVSLIQNTWIQMILTKRCLVLSIRIQLQISTFLAIKVEASLGKDQCGYTVMMEICDKLCREALKPPWSGTARAENLTSFDILQWKNLRNNQGN